ncbi:tetratricopeptide repeat-containing protein [Schleiferiaceae bacterium]|nr:tetratricopeptide repeat-containing protein [Schleiferiaceae bacterium]
MIVVFNLAYMYDTLGDVEKAIATYELALASEDPEARTSEGHYCRAMMSGKLPTF